ncbi:ABC transporter substrate-binding protein [uncultured Amnibacterium sp.]|uniref:ABC transporter substrate-binding protein n=1 Tax=uncultured Amnibacterium sp. TaxID=1631851 RepID=UPI0035C9E244
MHLRTRIAAIAVIAAMPISLTACSSGDPLAAAPAKSSSDSSGSSGSTGTTSIVVGSANFPESELLATIYAKALTGVGVKATTKLSIGSREVYFPALKDGSIDLLPEYTGATLSYLDPKAEASSPDDVAAALKTALPSGVEMLTPSDAADADTLTVTKATAAKYSLTTISDLKPYASKLVVGGPPEWKTRKEGAVGLKTLYGLNFKQFRALDAGGPLTIAALKNGQIDAGDVFSTDPNIAALFPLKDDKNLFPAQNIVPLIASAKKSDTVDAVLDKVSAALTTDDLVEMNAKLTDKQPIDTVAADWVQAHDLG